MVEGQVDGVELSTGFRGKPGEGDSLGLVDAVGQLLVGI